MAFLSLTGIASGLAQRLTFPVAGGKLFQLRLDMIDIS
jgi:hypothetical protein